jgi:hypothetical protein
MSKIVLIACVSQKLNKKAKAKDLYTSQLFKYSLAYAHSLNPDKIFILSALHHLLDLEMEIEPYNVTLSNIPKSKRKEGLIVLSQAEKIEWSKKVVKMLSEQTDLQYDQFILLAGQEYIKPIKPYIKNLDDRLHGLRQGERVKYLKANLHEL